MPTNMTWQDYLKIAFNVAVAAAGGYGMGGPAGAITAAAAILAGLFQQKPGK